MAEPDKQQFGDGGDQWGEAARNLANAAKEDQVLLLVQRDGGRIFIPIRTKTK